jgi:thermitase
MSHRSYAPRAGLGPGAAALLLAVAAMLGAAAAEAQPFSRDGIKPSHWVAGELLVGFRAGVATNGRHALYRKHNAEYVDDVGPRTRIVRLRVPAGTEDAVMARMARMPEVKFVEKNYEFKAALIPNDPEYIGQWHLPMIRADQAWDLTQGGATAVIAILDSGVDATQPDFAGKLVAGYDTYANTADTSDAYGHGTEVAGVAAALTDNGVGVAGVAGASPIMPVRVTNNAGAATAASIANGIIWATDHGARVINLSFDGIAGNATISTAAEYAFNHGTLVVAASGNCACADGTAENPFVLSVSATDETDALAYFSSTGPYVDVAAPGTNIMTTAKFALYLPDSGTSLASPMVAGVAALMFAANSAMTPTLATQLLEGSAVDLGASGYDPNFGFGRIDALSAVNAAINYTPPADTLPPSVLINSPGNGATVSGTVVVDVLADDNVGVVKVDLLVDGLNYASDTASPYSFAWDASALANGLHTLEVVASDAAGNSASATIQVTLANKPPDTKAPLVSISAPAAASTVAGTVKVSASASDDTGVVGTELYVDGVLLATDATAPYEYSWNTTQYSEGTHTIDVAAADAAGNIGHATSTVTVSNAVRHAPVARNDAYTVPVRSQSNHAAQVLAVLLNDSDADGDLDALSLRIVTAPNKGGTVKVNANGTVSYQPRPESSGVETFSYTVADKFGATSNVATVTVTLNPRKAERDDDNDAPGKAGVRGRGPRR